MSQSNKQSEAPKRDAQGRLLPGSTANPGGQNKRVAKLRKELMRLGPKAVFALETILVAGDAKDQLAAAKVVLEFTMPKPRQAVDVNASVASSPFAGKSTEELLALVQAARAGKH